MNTPKLFFSVLIASLIIGGALAVKANKTQTGSGNLYYCLGSECKVSVIYSDITGDQTLVNPQDYYTGFGNGTCTPTNHCNNIHPTFVFEVED